MSKNEACLMTERIQATKIFFWTWKSKILATFYFQKSFKRRSSLVVAMQGCPLKIRDICSLSCPSTKARLGQMEQCRIAVGTVRGALPTVLLRFPLAVATLEPQFL